MSKTSDSPERHTSGVINPETVIHSVARMVGSTLGMIASGAATALGAKEKVVVVRAAKAQAKPKSGTKQRRSPGSVKLASSTKLTPKKAKTTRRKRKSKRLTTGG